MMRRFMAIWLSVLLVAQLSVPVFGSSSGFRGWWPGRNETASGAFLEESTEPDPGEPDPGEPVVEDASHAAYVSGYPDGSFLPDRAVSRAETAKLIYSLGNYPAGAAGFSDVNAHSWYAKPVNALCAPGF